MTLRKKIKTIIIFVVISILSALTVYTVVHIFSGTTFEKTLNTMLTDSVIENISTDDIETRSAISSAPLNNHYRFFSTKTKSEKSELFVIQAKGWFGHEFLKRYKIYNHSSSDNPIDSCILEIRNSDFKKVNVLCVYSANTLKIQRIHVEISNTKTGDTQKVEFYTETLEPIASTQEIGNEDFTVKSIKCYNMQGELVYSK